MVRETHLWSRMITWQCGDVWLRGELKAQYILYGKVYDHKTWQVEDLLSGKGTQEATCSSDCLVK